MEAAAATSLHAASAGDAGNRRPSISAKVISRQRQKLRQLHDELTECPICLVEFTVPKQLPCMHTFCLACLRSMTVRRDPGDRLPCPVCSQPFAVPPGGVDALPKNYVVARLVELLRTPSIQGEPDETYAGVKDNAAVTLQPPVYAQQPPAAVTLSNSRVTLTSTTATVASQAAQQQQEQPQFSNQSISTATSASQQFQDRNVVRNVDQRPSNVPQAERGSVRDLIRQLIHARDVKDDLERARILFRWLTNHDKDQIKFDPGLASQRSSPEELLTRFKSNQASYSEVFQTICNLADVRCQSVKGQVKIPGTGSKGDAVDPSTANSSMPESPFQIKRHVWNAVEIGGRWHLVDCAWAASNFRRKQQAFEKNLNQIGNYPSKATASERRQNWRGKKVKASDDDGDDNTAGDELARRRYCSEAVVVADYFFMTDPTQLIFTHFPDDNRWQLTEKPIGLADFEKLVPVTTAFFQLGLRFVGLQSSQAIIRTSGTEVTLRLGCPDDRLLAFTFSLHHVDQNGRMLDRIDNAPYSLVPLDHYGMHETVDGMAHFRIRLPVHGRYRLNLFADDVTNIEDVREMTYDGVCEYTLVRNGEAATSATTAGPIPAKLLDPRNPSLSAIVAPYPSCGRTSWGPCPGPDGRRLKPLLKGSAIFTCNQDRVVELRFRFADDLSREMLRFTAELKGRLSGAMEGTSVSNASLDGCVLARVVGRNCDIAAITVNVPDSGEYGLEIYASAENSDGDKYRPGGGDTDSYRLAGQYLIVCRDNSPAVKRTQTIHQFPRIAPGYLGPQSMFHKLGLSVISHVDPYINLSAPSATSPTPLSPSSCAGSVASRPDRGGREVRLILGSSSPPINLVAWLTRANDHQPSSKRLEMRSGSRLVDYVLHQRPNQAKSRGSLGSADGSRSRNLTPVAGGATRERDELDDSLPIEFVVRLPTSGLYRLEIFAKMESMSNYCSSSASADSRKKSAGDDEMDDSAGGAAAADDHLVPIYNYVIDCSVTDLPAGSGVNPSSGHTASSPVQQTPPYLMPPFPRQSDLWRNGGCYLHAPLDGKLAAATGNHFFESSPSAARLTTRTAMFRMEVPRADSVAVVVDDGEWQYLERRGDHNLWCGEVELKRKASAAGRTGAGRSAAVRVEVCAHYPRETASFHTLLDYTAEI